MQFNAFLNYRQSSYIARTRVIGGAGCCYSIYFDSCTALQVSSCVFVLKPARANFGPNLQHFNETTLHYKRGVSTRKKNFSLMAYKHLGMGLWSHHGDRW